MLSANYRLIRFFVIVIVASTTLFTMMSCDANDEVYGNFIGDWHLVRINANGEYRKPIPGGDTCFNLHFMKNNSMIGESVSSSFSSVYNIRKGNKIVWSGFNYQPAAEDETDNLVFMNNMIKVNTYNMYSDTLKFFYDKKTYLVFVRK